MMEVKNEVRTRSANSLRGSVRCTLLRKFHDEGEDIIRRAILMRFITPPGYERTGPHKIGALWEVVSPVVSKCVVV